MERPDGIQTQWHCPAALVGSAVERELSESPRHTPGGELFCPAHDWGDCGFFQFPDCAITRAESGRMPTSRTLYYFGGRFNSPAEHAVRGSAESVGRPTHQELSIRASPPQSERRRI